MAQWHDLPGDIKLEILSRLPPKSLLHSKCVCKSWLALFSNPNFIKKHLLHRTAAYNDCNEFLLIYNRTRPQSLLLLDLKESPNPIAFNLDHPIVPHKNMAVVGSINGLVCLSSETFSSILILWNPATKQYKSIPSPNIKLLPLEGDHSVGFCFDSLKNDYKIVRVVFPECMQLRPRAELYSVSTDCWREIEVEIPFKLLSTHCHTIVNGEPYWKASLNDGQVSAVVWFDVGKEVFQQRRLLGVPDHGYFYGPVNFENSVALLVSEPTVEWGQNGKIGLWVTEDDSLSWSMKLSMIPSTSTNFALPGFSKNGELVLLNEYPLLQLYWYNPKTRDTRNIQIESKDLRFPQEHFVDYQSKICNYTASLVPIRGSKQVDKYGSVHLPRMWSQKVIAMKKRSMVK